MASLRVTTMLTLQEQLAELIKERGESSPLVQMLRNQIMAAPRKNQSSDSTSLRNSEGFIPNTFASLTIVVSVGCC